MSRYLGGLALLVMLLWLLLRGIRSIRLRQLFLLLASYLFYATFGLRFLLILIASSLFNYFWGAYLRKQPTSNRLWAGIAVNLALLGYFKYVPALAFAVPRIWGASLENIVLPVGISFWTFQGLSYLLDTYREEELDPSLLEFCLYMGFGPTVLSGPICRLSELLGQFREPFAPKWDDVRAGLGRVWLGVFLMTAARILGSGLVAGTGVDAGFQTNIRQLTAPDIWILALGYGFQLFFDFAGYSHIAIGSARLFGFRLPENFNHPYLSTTPSVFWTRWHMSLSFWIRDYVFLPLATLRRSVPWRNLALVLSMVIFGLWHKPKLTFVIWGAYQGLLLVAHRLWQQLGRRLGFEWRGPIASGISWAVTFFGICLGWLFFRAESLRDAISMFKTIFLKSSYVGYSLSPQLLKLVILVCVTYFLLEVFRHWSGQREDFVFSWMPLEFRYACYAVMLYLIVFRAAQPQGFIYFQF